MVATTIRISILVMVVGALAVGGCSSPVGPGGTLVRADRPYYPLTVGNHWVYNARGVVSFDSSGVWTVRDQHYSVEVEVGESVHWQDRTYLLERSRNQFAGLDPTQWRTTALRQDSRGLYESTNPVFSTAIREPGGAPPNEIPRLVFPLLPGVQWTYGIVHLRAERIEFVTVPAGRFKAWRVAFEARSNGELDSGTIWYANVGLVKAENYWKYPDGTHGMYRQELKSFSFAGPEGKLIPTFLEP